MKKEYPQCPQSFEEDSLPGFASWQEFIAAVPAPLAAVTGYKANGKTNVTMQSWCTIHGDHLLFAGVDKGSHMYGIALHTGELVANFPSADIFNRCMLTIDRNRWEDDEIEAAGLTAEPSLVVSAPRIAECPLSLECRYLWEHDLEPEGNMAAMCLKIVNLAMDPGLFQEGRYGKGGYLYNVRSRGNPETGERSGPQVGFLSLLGAYGQLPG